MHRPMDEIDTGILSRTERPNEPRTYLRPLQSWARFS